MSREIMNDGDQTQMKSLRPWAINRELLEEFKAKIEEDNLDIQIEEGESFVDPNGDTMIEVVVFCREPGLIEKSLDDCINSFYGLI